MKVPVESLHSLAGEFIDKELIPKGDPTQKFFTALFGAAVSRQIPSIVQQYRPFLEMAGVLRENKMDFDAMREMLTETFAKVPNFTLFGVTFNQADVDVLHQLAKRYQT